MKDRPLPSKSKRLNRSGIRHYQKRRPEKGLTDDLLERDRNSGIYMRKEMTVRIKRRRGRPTRYPGKNKNRLINLAMTDLAREHCEKQADARGLSKVDYIEGLIRGDIQATKIT